jgi:hypothetical protein
MPDDIKDESDRILTFLHLCEEEGHHRLKVPLRSMDGAVPLDMTEDHARSDGRHEFLIPVNYGAPAVWPIDVRTVQDANAGVGEDGEKWPDGTLQFHRTRTITMSEARTLGASRYSARMVMDEVVSAKPDGTAISARAPVAQIGDKWVNAAPSSIDGYLNQSAIPIALGLALAIRYEWSVWIGHNDGPRVRFLTDPLGAREAFALRDLPPGKMRRAAIRHWVTAHWRRQKRDSAADRAWIREHLRGTTDFTWNGLRCRIQPSDFDVEKAAEKMAAHAQKAP